MFGFFITKKNVLKKALKTLNTATKKWTMKAARNEVDWICASCSCSFPNGMPNECIHGDALCTDIISRDKKEAFNSMEPVPGFSEQL